MVLKLQNVRRCFHFFRSFDGMVFALPRANDELALGDISATFASAESTNVICYGASLT
jgi:hypothetical protein